MDNFVRFLPRSQPTLRKAAYDNCAWTVTALISLPQPHGTIEDDPDILLILPNDILDVKLISAVQSDFKKRQALGDSRFDASLTRTSTSLPIRVPGYVDLKHAGARAPKAVVMPVAIHDQNISSNDGLRDVLIGQYVERGVGAKHYEVALCDTNIFRRILKVPLHIYSPMELCRSLKAVGRPTEC